MSERSERVKDFQHEKRNFVSPSSHVMFYLLYKHQWNTKPFQWNSFFSCERRNLLCSHSNGDIFTCENTMLFSRVKIPCFRAKAHLVFHWCLHSKIYYYCYTAYCIVLLFLFIYFKIICCSSEYKTLIVTRTTTFLWGGKAQ